MESTLYVAATVAALVAWHVRNRRHPGWQASDEGRSYLLCGYSVVVTLAYWLAVASDPSWEWGVAGVWALGGLAAFVLGFGAMNRAAAPNPSSPHEAIHSDHSFDAASPPAA
ncbi:hypothetical protein [Mycobacterium sp. 236(2023)]|uniref:hypothetical protein n=1 Tax=Mycobacterium sp. 236(2023) TaxID=3038163 RepID=UPI00241540E4|nr:hypothetical protein [Mycobacterium sp. 236(2023)]MDG4664261.1 hypothetical protein [Mycobacterium sp. 236(2023)]